MFYLYLFFCTSCILYLMFRFFKILLLTIEVDVTLYSIIILMWDINMCLRNKKFKIFKPDTCQKPRVVCNFVFYLYNIYRLVEKQEVRRESWLSVIFYMLFRAHTLVAHTCIYFSHVYLSYIIFNIYFADAVCGSMWSYKYDIGIAS